MAAVGPEFARHAPFLEHIPTAVATCLTMLTLYLLVPASEANQRASLFPVSRVAAFAVSVALSVLWSLLAGATIYIALLVFFWLRRRLDCDPGARFRRLLLDHVGPFVAIAVSYCVLLPSVSPFFLYHAASRSYETYLSSTSLAIRNYVASHYFSFSPFTHTFWGMIQDMPTGLTSPVLAFLGLLDISSLWEASSFFKLLSLIYYAGYVFAGYFLFLLLREFRVRASISLATALVLFVGNQFYLNMVSQDMGWAGCSFTALTASLWLLAVALRRDSFTLGGWSGLALASQFYVVAPHPEMTIYSVVIYILVALSCVLITPTSSRLRGFLICVVSGAIFTLFSLAYLIPVVSQIAAGSMVVLGEDTTVPPSFAFQIPGLAFYVVLLSGCAALEFLRWRKLGRPRPVLVACLIVAVPILVLAIPGVPTAVRATFAIVGWTVHLQPFDRLLAYMGFAALIVAALGLDAAIGLVPPTQVKRLMVRLTKEHRPFAGSVLVNLAEVGVVILLLVAVPWMVGSNPSVAIIDGSLWGVRESIEAVLANSLTEADKRSSVPFLRERLLEFERRSVSWRIPMIPTVRKEYDAALAKYGVKTVQELVSDKVREFAYSVAHRIDELYASVEWLDAIPENVDRHLAYLDNPYERVMAVVGTHDFERQKGQRAFLSVARNVISAHNNSMMMDTRVYIGYPSVQALYIYPRNFLPHYRPIIKQDNYFISGERPPWHYETEDVIGNEFRKLLGIAGIGAYLMLPEKAVREALERPTEDLRKLSRAAGKDDLMLVRDRRAYDTAYLARVVGMVDATAIDELAAASRKFFSQRIDLGQFRELLDPAAEALLAMPKRHDALVEKGGDSSALGDAIKSGVAGEGPSARGGKLEIKGAIGPRIGLDVTCPDPQCVAVYNLAALPGWRAYVDGKAQPILRANYAFISLAVPNGSHFVSLFYETAGQSPAEWISLLTLLAMLGWARWENAREGAAARP